MFLVESSVPKEKLILQTKNKGLEGDSLPQITYFLQDDKDANKIVAVQDPNSNSIFRTVEINRSPEASLITRRTGFEDKTRYYWCSVNFGEIWEKTDSSILKHWNIRDSVINRFSYNRNVLDFDSVDFYAASVSKHSKLKYYNKYWLKDTITISNKTCILNYKDFKCYINENILKAEIDYCGFNNTAWIDDRTFYAVSNDGILIGKSNENCEPVDEMFWDRYRKIKLISSKS